MSDPSAGDRRTLPPDLPDRTAVLLRAALERAEAMGEEALRPLGVSGREYGVLFSVWRAGAWSSQRRLGAALGLDRTTTMKVVGDLVRRGFVDRRVDPNDRRAFRVGLTASGRRLVANADRRLADCDEQLTAGRLDASEAATLQALLRRLT